MILIRQSEIPTFETPGGNSTRAIVPSGRGATEVRVIQQRQQPGGQNPLHYHDRQEVLVVQSGQVIVTIDGEQARLAAGDVVIVPAGAVHQVANSGSEAAEWLLVVPHGLRFFRPTGEEQTPVWF